MSDKLEKMLLERPPTRKPRTGLSTLLAASLIMGGMLPSIGGPGYRYPQPKNTDNSPDRAKGMKPFDIDGHTIYAGTAKAARKKAKLLRAREHSHNTQTP